MPVCLAIVKAGCAWVIVTVYSRVKIEIGLSLVRRQTLMANSGVDEATADPCKTAKTKRVLESQNRGM
jgi:hypothetical protein